MGIRLRPELEELTKQDVQRGSYQTVDEFVERAVSMLHEQEVWLAENRAEVETKIDQGYAADQVEEAVFRACDFLAVPPLVGRMRKDLTLLPSPLLGCAALFNYLIVHDAEKKPLQISRILHSARDLPSVLR
jgi:plasmid stabilization system protein ParE